MQALRWDSLIATILADGTMYKIFRGFVSPREARELVYSGPRDAK